MAGDLIDMFNSTVADAIIRKTSDHLGESADHITSATGAILPVLMGHLIQQTGTPAQARNLISYLRETGSDGRWLTHVNTLLNDPEQVNQIMTSGAGHLKFLLGDTLSAVVDAIAGGHSLKTSSASSLLKLTTTFFFHILGKYIQEKSLDGQGLRDLLGHHAAAVRSGWPADLPALSDTITQVADTSAVSGVDRPAAKSATPVSKYLPWIVLMLTSLGLFYFVEKGCGGASQGDKEEMELQENQETGPAVQDSN